MGLALTGLAPLLQVFDMPAALAFYRDVLGFEVVADSGVRDTPEGRFAHWVWLRLGGAEIMLNTAYDEGERPPAPDAARWSGHSDTVIFFGCADVDGAYAFLRGRIANLAPPQTAPYGMRQLSFSDPDGYQLCLQARADQSPSP